MQETINKSRNLREIFTYSSGKVYENGWYDNFQLGQVRSMSFSSSSADVDSLPLLEVAARLAHLDAKSSYVPPLSRQTKMTVILSQPSPPI